MDDEDSQEELINRCAAPGKKTALALVSDEEEEGESDETGSEDDESEEDGEEAEEEGEDEDLVDGSDSGEDDDDDDEEDDDDDEVEGEDEEELEGAVGEGGARTTKLATNGSRSSDEEEENCPICLNAFRDQVVGTPENCNHYFCLDCIVEWAKNATSCPVDRIAFSCICIRAHFGGGIIKKVPVENHAAKDDDDEEEDDGNDTTNCEVCGRCDREDRLLLCDGCDAGYHMECLNPPLNAIPVDEWFCPECAITNPPAEEEEHISEAEVSSLTAEVQPVASRLRTNVVRTRAIARTRQSERVRENVNRLRTRTARRNENVPRFLTSSLLDETIEAVVAGLSTAVYQRPLAPHVTTTRRKKTGRRRKGTSKKKPRGKVTTGNWMTGKKTKKRRRRFRRRKGRKITVKKEVSTRTRIAKTLGLCKPVRGVSIPAVRGSAEPSLGLLRSDIGAAALSVFGDPFALDPYDSQEDQTTGPPSPMSTKRRVLSRSALRSHQPVARPISVGMSRRGGAAAIQEDVEPAVATPAPISDLLGSILSEQNRLMMSSSDIVINRDGSLLARKSANTSSQKNGSGESREGSTTEDNRQGSSSISGTSTQTSSSTNTTTPSSSEQSPPIRPPSTSLFPISPSYSSSPRSLDWILNPTSKKSVSAVKFNSSFTPRAVQVQNIATAGRLGVKPAEPPRFNGNNKRASPSSSLSSNDGNSSQSATSRGTAAGHPPEPGAKRIELSELPRIPKIKREVTTGHHEPRVGKGGNSISDAYTSRLTGKGESRRPSRFTAIESSKPSSSKDPQETFKHVGSPTTASAYSGSTVHASGDKGSDSTARSAAGLKITINPGSGPSNRLFSPSMSSPFRPVESKSQTKPDPSPNCPISKKEKLVKNEIYDPFDPTGSNSSSACSSPEREEPSVPVPEHIKSSPDGSPTSPDGSPTSPVSLNSPVVTQASPDISQTSPDVARTSPDITRMVPEVTRTVPDVPRTVPDLSRKVPEVIRTIPEVSMVFPEVTRVFTEVNRVVPEVNRSFPEVTRKYPEVTRKVPEVKMTFPKVTMKFPDATRKFSDVSRKFPEVTRKFPEINRTFPEVTRTFPEVSLKFPDVTRKLSEVTRTFPEVTSKPPDITRTFPGISRSVPEVTRTFPSDPTKPGAFRSFRLLTTSTKVGISGLGSDFSDAPPTKIIHRDVLFEEPIKDGGSASEGDKDLKKKDTEQEKGGKESYKNFHASVTVKLSPERIKSVEVPRTWHDKEQRTLVSVKSDPDVPPKNKPQKAKRPYKDTKSRSRSRSNSSSRSRKKHKKEKKLFSKERKKKRSRSRSRSQSKEQNSRSASWSTEDDRAKKSRHKNKGRKLSSEHSSSSSHERLKKKKIKEIKKSKKKSSSSKDRRKTRSRSVSHGSSSSEFYENKKKKKRKSRSRERSRSSSVDREKRRKRKSEKNYDRYDKESSDLRFRERRRSKEKKKAKSRSTSPQIAKEYKRARSKEKWQAPKDRTVESKEIQLSPHRVVKLTGTYVENIPKLTVSYVENIPRRTVHSLVVNPDAKDPFKVQRRKELSDTSLETDSDEETSDEDNKLKDGIQPQVVKEASSEAVSLSGENESSPCESPDHLYNSSRLDVTDSVGSGIDNMHSDVKHEMTAIKEESIVQTSVGLKCSDREVVSHSPTHGVPEAVVSSDVPIEKGEDDDVDKMLDDNLNLVHSATVLLSEAAQKDGEDDSQNKLSDGTQKRLGNCDNFQLGFNAPDKLIEDAHAKFAASAPVTSSEVVHDKPGFGTLQLEDKTHESDSETDAKLGSDADSEVDDKVKKDEKQEVDKVIDEDEVEQVEDNSLVEGVAVDLLDNGSLQQVDDCSNEQVNSFSGNQAALISHDQPSNRSGHDFNCSADHIVDDFTDQKDDSSVHEEDLAVCRSDSFVPSGADEFVDRGMDNYSSHVVDGDPFYQGDRFADHQGNRLGDHQGDRLADHHLHEFSGHQITESDGPQEDKFEDQRMGDFGGRSMEEFARHLLDKFAGHGIGDFTCPKVTDVDNQVTEVAGSQITIIPGIGMGDVTDYHEEDTAVCQDDDYTGEQSEMEESSQSFALKSKQQVKRVTWNLQEEDSDTSTSEKTETVPFYKLLRSKEGPWKAFDPLSQTSNPVYSPEAPLTPPLPSSLPPFTPVSEPSAHYVMHESLPLLGCMAGSTVTSESGNLATASEPGMQSASTWDAEEKTLFHKPSLDRITQEYLKKLHIQERAVEEVKLAIKPFYQTREITKDEYKDILRKAVSKICHSKSGEINPVKVSNLIKAYVERYKHLRKHKREIEEYHDMGPESP